MWHLDGKVLGFGMYDMCSSRMVMMDKSCFYYRFERGEELYEEARRGNIF